TVNELFSNVELERLQHRHARFINICMKTTLLGAAVSDTLDSGQVVSGVGGQYNFVAMAHALKEARSILLLKSTHGSHGRAESNLVWSSGNLTIPRHLRDIVVTEYGIADLRGRTDREVIAALLNIADSRFQDGLLRQAQRAGKLPAGYRIPEMFRDNTPQRLRATLLPLRRQGLFADFPFGHEFTPEELVLGKGLQGLQGRSRTLAGKLGIAAALLRPVPAAAEPYLRRMGLDRPRGFKQRLLARLVAGAVGISAS
ncbi:MAG TPA: acetyl-CoA hydrolase/transferase C-terminal domain-containing protein, partial [Gammaproteobacteria bacterium]|nr:acetyl-CoA hydrolase/transferase C-terminal domain-containing protein [Gammaproteobacteria bacterium]